MENYDLIICTTAVTRPELHNQVLPSYTEFLQEVNCLWLVSVNPILKQNVQDTIDNFKRLTEGFSNLELKFYPSEVGGTQKSFYISVEQLMREANTYGNSKYGVLWLEDDWFCNNSISLREILDTDTPDSMSYVQLVKRVEGKVVSFNPGIWGWDLFRQVGLEKIQKPFSSINNNPERACVKPEHEVRKVVSTFYKYYLFKDLGRKWQKDKKIGRTFKLT